MKKKKETRQRDDRRVTLIHMASRHNLESTRKAEKTYEAKGKKKKNKRTSDKTELYKLFQPHPVVTTDSRDCPEGSIFFALKGESFDGNKFAAAALDKGGCCKHVAVERFAHEREENTSIGTGHL